MTALARNHSLIPNPEPDPAPGDSATPKLRIMVKEEPHREVPSSEPRKRVNSICKDTVYLRATEVGAHLPS